MDFEYVKSDIDAFRDSLRRERFQAKYRNEIGMVKDFLNGMGETRNENSDIHDVSQAIDNYRYDPKTSVLMSRDSIQMGRKTPSEEDKQKAVEWLINGHWGTSSKCLCAAMFGIKPEYIATPADPADFKRCVEFLDMMDASTQEYIWSRVKSFSKNWEDIAEIWPCLRDLYEIDKHRQRSPALYEALNKFTYRNCTDDVKGNP